MTTTDPTETAVGYIRLSQDGMSLARQHREVEDYATENDYTPAPPPRR